MGRTTRNFLWIASALSFACGDDSSTTPGTDSASASGTGDTDASTDSVTQSTSSTMSAGTDSAGTDSAGTESVGTDTASTDSVGTDTGNTDTVGTDTVSTGSTTDSTTSTSVGTGDSSGTTSTSDGSTTEGVCPQGEIVCNGNVAQECDGMGGFQNEQDCNQLTCFEGLGCLECFPGETQCNGDAVEECNLNGDAWEIKETCDGYQGLVCDANAGKCAGACADLGFTYLGCDYYPTVTANIVTENFHFAVAVANTSNQAADITITQGANMITQTQVAANSLQVINLPWVSGLKQTAGPPAASLVVNDGAYRLRSTQPVTVYQYNPIEYTDGGFNNSYTNDASLLTPVNTWQQEYFVASRNTWKWSGTTNYPGFYAVIAAEDNTQITVEPSSTGNANIVPGAGIGANGQGVVNLNQGDVLEVFSGGNFNNPSGVDLTGTRILSDKPIQVISGHQCTFVPHNIGYCDHLEESMLPFDALATDYVVTTPLVKPLNQNAFAKARFVRVIATTDNTMLSYDPPQNGAPAMIANAGDYVEIGPTNADFQVSANFKILVVEYMQGQDAGGNTGDPAMAIAVPTEQYRDNYLFHAPTNYEVNFVNITAPTGATITLDGVQVAANNFSPIGGTGFDIARVQLGNTGTHQITGDQAFGITVYGYGQYTSYWYPGGLDLEIIPQ